jgi:diketogulonate reductase-like aldo/keto reductase
MVPRRPAVHVTQLSREQIADLITASAWELTPAQWERMTDHERRERRRTVTTAPRFKVTA